jgi:ribosomal protein L22
MRVIERTPKVVNLQKIIQLRKENARQSNRPIQTCLLIPNHSGKEIKILLNG